MDCRTFTVWWKARPAAESPVTPRICVVASGAVVGGAVSRNRAKRRLREVFRRNQELVPPHCDLVVVARADVVRRPFGELTERFAEACRRIGSSLSASR